MDIPMNSLEHYLFEKRKLSLTEKATLISKDEFALIFLGPGSPEVEELLNIGFHPTQIIGIDTTSENVAEAIKLYPVIDKQNFINVDFKDFLPTYHGMKWSYVHLDYCGQPLESRIDQVIKASKQIVLGGRLRVTFMFDDIPRGKENPFGTRYELRDAIHNKIWSNFKISYCDTYTSDKRRKDQMITMWFDKI